MNPSFMAYQKAMCKMFTNALMGTPHIPRNVKLDQTDGKLFAVKPNRHPDTGFPRSDIIVLAEEAEKEAKVQAHLSQLAKEAKQRSDKHGKHITMDEHGGYMFD